MELPGVQQMYNSGLFEAASARRQPPNSVDLKREIDPPTPQATAAAAGCSDR
jgi:hypothetical protein